MSLRLPLFGRFVVWFLLNLALLGVVFGLLVRSEFRFESLMAGTAGERVQKVAEVMLGELRTRPRTEWDQTLKRFSETYGVTFVLTDDRGDRLAGPALEVPAEVQERMRLFHGGPRHDGPPPPDSPEPPRRPGPGPPRGFVRAGSPPAYWVVIPAMTGPPDGSRPPFGRLVIKSPTLSAGGLFFDFTPWWIGGGAVLVLSVLWWLPFIGSITRALGRMTAATESISEGKFDVALPDQRGDELGRLGGAINRMAARLAGFVTGQKRFLGDIAHELCSPLARMEMALGVLDQRADEHQREYLGDVREEVRHMSGLVNELLSFSKAGLKGKDLPLSAVALRELVERIVARESDGTSVVRVEVPAELSAQAEPELLARAVGNLLRNALRYAGQAGPIVVDAAEHGDLVVLKIADAGPGVPPAALPRLGEPFFRPDLARDRESGGTGLGLAIVRTCVEACRGTVTFRNRQPTGLEAELKLRRA